MAGSWAEGQIREATIECLRAAHPDARIIHELVVAGGTIRMDLAAVTPERLLMVEIKSQKDTLSRLPRQARYGHMACHAFFLVADEKFFKLGPKGKTRIDHACDNRGVPYFDKIKWPFKHKDAEKSFAKPYWRHPHFASYLNLLWNAELMQIISDYGLPKKGITRSAQMVKLLIHELPGKEITRAVCHKLRQRTFAEADAPIVQEYVI